MCMVGEFFVLGRIFVEFLFFELESVACCFLVRSACDEDHAVCAC